MGIGRAARSAILGAAFTLAGPAMAAKVMVSGSGTWDDATVGSAYTAAGSAFSFSFEIEQTVLYNPVTDFLDFRYLLGGNPVAGKPMEISFLPEAAGGGFQFMFAPDDLFVAFGMPMLDSTNLTLQHNAPMSFVTNTGFASGNMSVSPTTAVPEPATWLTMVLGIGAIGVVMRRGKPYRRMRPLAASE